MSTGIQWTDETWNPVVGCSITSPGCKNCYAMKMARRLEAMGQPRYAGLTQVVHGHAVWTGQVRSVEEALSLPLRWQKPRRVFVNSMSDLFHEAVPREFIARVFAVMRLGWAHEFQVLTKRPERMRQIVGDPSFRDEVARAACQDHPKWMIPADRERGMAPIPTWPLPNVWLGTSAERQQEADERIPELILTPAAVRFVSYEPALGRIDFEGPAQAGRARGFEEIGLRGDLASGLSSTFRYLDGLDWIIVGGESGPGARPFDLAWARTAIRQCQASGVACFVKQLGARPYSGMHTLRGHGHPTEPNWLKLKHPKGGDPAEWPEDLRVREFPEVAP